MNHYDRLGVDPGATQQQIRDAYRRAARSAHPDRHGDQSSTKMAAVNEAHRVLGDPARRAAYDLRRTASSPVEPVDARAAARGSGAEREPAHAPIEYYEPARVPWKFLLALGSVGVGVILAGVIVYEPAPPGEVDNILRSGDCVTLSNTLEAAEVRCDLTHDATVNVLVPFDKTCPIGTEPFRDRQGMGTACVVRND